MHSVSILEAESMLAKLVDAAIAGELVVIERDGKPVVQLKSFRPSGIRLGTMKGRIPASVIDSITRPLTRAEIYSLFGGRFE